MSVDTVRPFLFRVTDLPVGTRAFAYQAAFDPNLDPAGPARPETCQLVGSDNPNGKGFGTLKNVRPGWTRIQCGTLWSDEFFWDGDPTKTIEFSVAGGKLVPRVGGVPIPPVPPGNVEDLKKQFTKGTYTAAFSYYGMLGAPLDRIKRDLERFRTSGFGNARVWIDWSYFEITGSSVFDKNGNFIESVAKKLDDVFPICSALGMSLDLTMHAAHYRTERESEEGYNIEWHLGAIQKTLIRWGTQPAFRIFDLANEAEVRGPSPGSGSPAAGHVSPKRLGEMMQVVRSLPHSCLAGVSISPAGDYKDVILNYQAIFRDTRTEILLPHFARNSGWGAQEGARGLALAKAIPGLPVHHQEPARNGHSTQPGKWPLAEFEASFRTTKSAGAVGCCLHGDFGFDVRTKDAWDQLDNVEAEAVKNVSDWIR